MTYTLRDFRKSDLPPEAEELGDGPTIGISVVDDADGALVSYACMYCINDRDWLFFWWHPERPRAVSVLHRNAIKLLDTLGRNGFGEVFAICDYAYGDRADSWLRRLGFTPLAEDEKCVEIRHHEAANNALVFKAWLRPAQVLEVA